MMNNLVHFEWSCTFTTYKDGIYEVNLFLDIYKELGESDFITLFTYLLFG